MAAHDFVAGCLNKIPNLRPTYPMLLQHAWLAPLDKPNTITEEEEEEDEENASSDHVGSSSPNGTTSHLDNGGFFDRQVGEWVVDALERRRTGVMGKSVKPALHTAPLDVVSNSPQAEIKPALVA